MIITASIFECESVADQYPSAEVLGVDFTPIQPHWMPRNLNFIVDDIEQEWMYGSDFDFIHFRQVFPVLKNTTTVLERAFEYVTSPTPVSLFIGN